MAFIGNTGKYKNNAKLLKNFSRDKDQDFKVMLRLVRNS